MSLHNKTWWIPPSSWVPTLGLNFPHPGWRIWSSKMRDSHRPSPWLLLHRCRWHHLWPLHRLPHQHQHSWNRGRAKVTLWLEMRDVRDLVVSGVMILLRTQIKALLWRKVPQSYFVRFPQNGLFDDPWVWEAKLWLSWKSSGFIVSGSWISLSGIWVKYLFANFLEA